MVPAAVLSLAAVAMEIRRGGLSVNYVATRIVIMKHSRVKRISLFLFMYEIK